MLSVKHHHAKDSVNEIPSLHVDIDLKDIDDSKAEVIRKLKTLLRLPPSFINDSGNGCHAYWKFREPIILDQDTSAAGRKNRQKEISRVDDALKLLCDLVGGDIKPAHTAALMRLPGSHNSKKEDQYHAVTTVWKNNGACKTDLVVYELDDLEEFLAEASPKILRKDRPPAKTVGEDNSFENYGDKIKNSYKPKTDVIKRLDDMMFMGAGNSAIHETQLSVSASLLGEGESNEDIVSVLMDATRKAAGK